MRDPGQGEGAHRAALAGADSCRCAKRHRRQQAQNALKLLNDDTALGDAFKAKEADLAETGIEIGQDIDGLRHFSKRIAAGIKRVTNEGHGDLLVMGFLRVAARSGSGAVARQDPDRGQLAELGGNLGAVIDRGVISEACA